MFNLEIDKDNIKCMFQVYLPSAFDKLDGKMERVLHQAICNLNIQGGMFGGTFLAQPAMRVLEGHLKKIVLQKEIAPNHDYLKYNGFDMFKRNGLKYQIDPCKCGKANDLEKDYLGRCYTFCNNNRHRIEHWDDPTTPIDTTRTLNYGEAHDLIKEQ